jgi:hypothetical protein
MDHPFLSINKALGAQLINGGIFGSGQDIGLPTDF